MPYYLKGTVSNIGSRQDADEIAAGYDLAVVREHQDAPGTFWVADLQLVPQQPHQRQFFIGSARLVGKGVLAA